METFVRERINIYILIEKLKRYVLYFVASGVMEGGGF